MPHHLVCVLFTGIFNYVVWLLANLLSNPMPLGNLRLAVGCGLASAADGPLLDLALRHFLGWAVT